MTERRLLTYLLTELSSSREAATVQPLKSFPTFQGTRMFITVFTRAIHWSLSWAKLIQSIPSHPISLKSVLTFFFIYLVCEAIGTAATPGLLCQPRVIVKMTVEKQMECRFAGETEVLRENTCLSVTFVHHKIPHDQTRVWTRAAAVGSRRLTAWAMARPCFNIDVLVFLVVSFLLAFPPISYMHSLFPHSCYIPYHSHPPWLD
jgi:hypothetical protein